MKTYLLTIAFILSLFTISPIQAQTIDEPEKQHKEEIENLRSAKDQLMKQEGVSPLTPAEIEKFKGLDYYDINYDYKIRATFTPVEGRETVSLNTTGETKIDLIKYGTATFSIGENTYTFSIYRNNNLPEFGNDDQILFIPFSDLSAGKGSNEGGRYLRVEAEDSNNNIVLDFNTAMNPFNAYNKSYIGVIPPPENAPQIIIETGERKYEDR
jgi:hypothetical protein